MPTSKIVLFGQHFYESSLWQRKLLASPFEKGDQRGIFKTVCEILPIPLSGETSIADFLPPMAIRN
jgi:hypothetical protein